MSEKIFKTGQKPGSGCCKCTNCGQQLDMGTGDKLPPCPRCSNDKYHCEC